jgi:hypothetical protein
MKVYLRDLAFESAKEVEVTTNKKAVIIQVGRTACLLPPAVAVGPIRQRVSPGRVDPLAADPDGRVVVCPLPPRRCRTGCCPSTTRGC